jgi:anti-sigma factor RsiW
LGEDLQLFLDGRLDTQRRALVEGHVDQCPRCARELEAMRRVKETMRQLLPEPPPDDLGARLAGALDAEDRRSGAVLDVASRRRRRRLAVAGALLVAAALLLMLVNRPRGTVLPSLVAGDFASYARGALPLEIESTDPAAVEAFFRSRGIRFPTRVFDLGMMGYRLLGGRVHQVAQGPSALFAYRGPDERDVICQMFVGRAADLPSAEQVLDRSGIRFYVYREGGMTLVFWQEGEVVCVLASDGDPDEVIQLAYAKAMPRRT